MVFKTARPIPLGIKISVRVTPSEKSQLDEDAITAGLSLSELMRRRFFGRPIVATADAAVLRELRRLGGLLKHIHVESKGLYSQQTEMAINTIKEYIEKMGDKNDR